MEEVARGYPAGSLLVSTGSLTGSQLIDATLPNEVDRIGVAAGRLKTAPGLLRWSHRAAGLAGNPSARFGWVGNLRPAAFPAWWAHERTALPYGVMVYGGDLLTLGSKLARSSIKRAIYRPILGKAAVYVAISQWTAERRRALLEGAGLPSEGRVRVVPPGTDPERWRPDQGGGRAFRRRRGLPDGRWLVSVARLVPHKGIDTTLRLIAALAPEHPDLHYLVVGRGPHEAALRRLAGSLGVADRFHLCTDVDDDELPAAYAAADIYLGLSREEGLDVEGFGIVLLEASAAGLPVVAGRSGGIPDAVAEGESGVLVNPLDVAEAAAAVSRLLADRLTVRRMGEAGRARVISGFTWRRVTDDLRGISAELGRR